MKIFTEHRTGLCYRYIRLLGAMLMVALMTTSVAMSIQTLDLLSTSNFVILAGSTVTGIPPVSMTGDVGLYPAAGSYISGFDGTNVTGILYVRDATGPAGSVINATLLLQAKSDLTTAYNDAAGRTPVPTGPFLNPNGGNIGGLNLVPGLYKFTSDCQITGADVTLTGNATDVWIFQIASLLNLGSGIHIILAGDAKAANIFWQVGTSATLGTYSVFKGTILADQSISLGTGATMDGRALAFSAAVTMASGVTTTKPGMVTTAPIFSVNPIQLAFGDVSNGLSKRDSVTVTNSGTANLIIGSVTSSNTLFTVTPTTGTISPGLTQKFYVTFAPIAVGLQNGYIHFNHNASNLKDSISVSGTGTSNNASPEFSASTSELIFGDVKNGLSKRDSVTVTNSGTANLIIGSVTSSNTLFTVTPTNVTISPGLTQKFYVTFAPLAVGLQNGYIHFNHNASNLKDSISVSGTGVPLTGVSDPMKANQYSLLGNYPNPFNSSTTIQYTLGIADFVSLKVFDVLGQDVATLVNGFQDAGTYTVPFSVAGNTLSSGSSVYFYRLEVGPSGSTKKMILVK